MNGHTLALSNPTHEEIEACAYYIYLNEGRPEGRALDHWLQAELQLALTRMHDAARERSSAGAGKD